ncbi:male accessory gland serine protease inhibitor [Drosophila elegans]|uniref:male accessory gland serine protease inhibitor n=1 Tax=Drosophila elegans TaxID=30023 RepID=UPI0007E6F93A|nr:male accessory gland serine protease inhibitor [Drosophila elegans]
MKYLAVLAVLFCLLGAAMAQLKNPICGEESALSGSTCRGLLMKWTYRKDTNDCVDFNYTGCHGNNNRFDSKEQCEQSCKN